MDRGTAPLSRHNEGWQCASGRFGDPGVMAAQRLHREVYEDKGYVSDLQVITIDGLFVDEWSWAAHHVALHADGLAVGHVRLIDRTSGPLPSQLLWPELELPDECWEVSALAIRRDHAQPFATVKQLYRHAFHYALQTSCTHWIGIIEYPLLRILSRWFPMRAVGPEVELYGTRNVPALLSFEDCDRDMTRGQMDPWFRPTEGAAAHRLEALAARPALSASVGQ